MMLMTLFGNVQRRRDAEQKPQRVAECILRHDGSATNLIIAERTRFSDAEIDEQATALREAGVITSRDDERGRTFHELTDAGRAQVEAWMEERKAADAELFSALSEEEQEQLEGLLAKAFDAFMPPMFKRR